MTIDDLITALERLKNEQPGIVGRTHVWVEVRFIDGRVSEEYRLGGVRDTNEGTFKYVLIEATEG